MNEFICMVFCTILGIVIGWMACVHFEIQDMLEDEMMKNYWPDPEKDDSWPDDFGKDL